MADDKRLLTAELLGVLGFTADLPRGKVLERVHQDTLKFSRQLVGLLLFAVELGDVASVEALADQAQQRLDGLTAQAAALEGAIAQATEQLAATKEEARDTAAASVRAAAEHDRLALEAAASTRADAGKALREAKAKAEQIIAGAETRAAAHVEKVVSDHAELEASIEAKTGEHAELERKIADRRAALADLRSQAARLTGE